jgi:hypothetical protein
LSATVADFLEAWLVEGNPAQALAHLSVEAYPCVLELQEHAESDEMAPLFILQSMERAKAHLGDVARLSDVVAPLPVPNVRMTQVRHENDDIFTLVRIPPSPW